MKKFTLWKYIALIIGLLTIGAVTFLVNDVRKIGTQIDSYREVPVYYNGIVYTKAYGTNYSKDGYYLGQKWQCVEYIKRFYFQAKKRV